jgi:spore coat protein U-like protein
MTKRIVLALALALTLAAFLPARLARAASCSFNTVTGVSFGTYDVFAAAPTPSAGNLAYTCTGGATVTIALSKGSAPSFVPRWLLGPPAFHLQYNLYLDAGLSTIWGDGTGVTGLYGPSSPADNATVMVPIFGSIPAGQDVPVGSYSDTITATITF